MDTKVWFSRRALKLHLVILVVVPAFMALCVWQIYRATGGNELSWAYVFEWPFFAAYAIYMWWRLLHADPEVTTAAAVGAPGGQVGVDEALSAADPHVAAEQQQDNDDLAAYNRYLEQLAEQDRASGR
jgi:hypothetical protein